MHAFKQYERQPTARLLVLVTGTRFVPSLRMQPGNSTRPCSGGLCLSHSTVCCGVKAAAVPLTLLLLSAPPGADRIIDACNGALIVHRTSNPEPFISRAGTVWREQTAVTQPARQPGLISAVLFDARYEMPRHTTRAEEFPRIDPNEARSLPPGEAFVIADGKAQRVAVATVHDLHEMMGDLDPEVAHAQG